MSRTVRLFAGVLVTVGLVGAAFAAPVSGSVATQPKNACQFGVKIPADAAVRPTVLPAAIAEKALAFAKFSAREGRDAVVMVRRNPAARDINWALLLVKTIRQAGGPAHYEGPAAATRANGDKPSCPTGFDTCVQNLPISGG